MWIKIIKRTLFFFIILLLSVNIIFTPYVISPMTSSLQNNSCVIENTITNGRLLDTYCVSKDKITNNCSQNYHCGTKQTLYSNCPFLSKVHQGKSYGIIPQIFKRHITKRTDQTDKLQLKNMVNSHYRPYIPTPSSKIPNNIHNVTVLPLAKRPSDIIKDDSAANSPSGGNRKAALRQAKRRNCTPACDRPTDPHTVDSAANSPSGGSRRGTLREATRRNSAPACDQPTDTPMDDPASNRPPNMSPPGVSRRGALREAKRRNSIPVCDQPTAVLPNCDKRGKPIPGKIYVYQDKKIRDDIHGHEYPDNPSQNRGPHFNDDLGRHYDY